MSLSIGTRAPAFSLPATDGREISLDGLKGSKVVLYFYPKDDTSGCTLEAQNFQALKADFEAADTEIVGVSPDSLKSHESPSFRRNVLFGNLWCARLKGKQSRDAPEAVKLTPLDSLNGAHAQEPDRQTSQE